MSHLKNRRRYKQYKIMRCLKARMKIRKAFPHHKGKFNLRVFTYARLAVPEIENQRDFRKNHRA